MYLTGAVTIPPDTEPTNVKSIVDANRKKFEQNAEALEEAEEMLQTDGPREDAWAQIAPEVEAERLECAMDKEQLNEEDIFEIPELDNTARKKKDRTKQQNEMVILLHNIQGLIPHINDIRSNSDISSANFVCLTETWLEKKTVVPSIEGFNFIHKDRFSSYHSKKDVF
ncbi:unnamed protein product [Mytilus coruscus]|uniref:Uncharacterized protein n=1 Tax=Mytilus coruscus TaxID=42192 RepID=A0A6J8BT92_MYTCO|nr:unnamed protein product [Mytilus coruscus]